MNKNIIERIKDIILVVLFLSTILLLYFFWEDISFKELYLQAFAPQETEKIYKEISIEEVIAPSQIIVCQGEGNYNIERNYKKYFYNKNPEDITNLIYCISRFSQEENILIEEIDKDRYNVIMEGPSLKARFDYLMPYEQFCSIFGIKKALGTDNIRNISELGYSALMEGSILIYDRYEQKYFVITVGKEVNYFKKYLETLIANSETTYLPLNSILGENVENQVLLPLSLTSEIEDFQYYREFSPEDSSNIPNIAKRFFGNNLDFVRRLKEESGTVIYMYGYGKKVLIANIDGTIEYKEETTGKNISSNFQDSLQAAMRFISSHGGFETVNGQPLDIMLKNAKIPDEKGQRYVFDFEIQIGNIPLYDQNGPGIHIEVINNEVAIYQRNYIEFPIMETAGEERECYEPINMLALNHEYISEFLKKEGLIDTQGKKTLTFEDIAELISKVDYGFIIPMGGTVAEVAWIVEFDDGGLYLAFDLEDATPITGN